MVRRVREAYGVLAKYRYSTIAGMLVFFLIMSLVPFLFWLTLLFGRSVLDFTFEGLEFFSWAEELFFYLRENALEAGRGVSVIFLATTLWSSTGFFYHLRRSGEMIYDYKRKKHGWKLRLSALLLTFCVLAFFALAGGILFVANIAVRYLSPWVSYPAFYGLILTLGFFSAWILNAYVCPYRCSPVDTALGSFYTALMWLLASVAFAVYLRFSGQEKLYGALALIVIFLLWLYWMMICFVAGVIYNRIRMRGRRLEHKKL